MPSGAPCSFTRVATRERPEGMKVMRSRQGVVAVVTALTAAACSPPPEPPADTLDVTRFQRALSGSTNDSRGTEFWLMFPSNLGSASLSLFIAGETATTGTVEIPGLSFFTTFSVTPGMVTTVSLPASAVMTGTDAIEARGVHLTAGAEVSVYGLNRLQFTTDAYLGLPVDIAGTDYVVLAVPNVNIVNGTQLGVVATQNDTVVTITPKVTTGSRPAGVPYNLTLDAGEAYQLRNTGSAPADVTGTSVTSDKPIAVFGGHQCANIPNGSTFACDHVVEQLPPTSAWGRNFVTVPLATRVGGDTFRFVAAHDDTQLSVNGAVVATLDRGQVHQRNINGMSTVVSSEPILMAQHSNGSTYDGVTSDPFMMVIPPHEQFLPSYTVLTPTSGFPINFINVAAPAAAVGAITLDGSPIAASHFSPIGASGFFGAQLTVSVGSHNLAGPLPFGTFVYGFGSFDSYGYPGGMSLSPVAIATSLTLTPETGAGLVGTQHCVTATVLDQNGEPVAEVRVDFAVTGAHTTAGFDSTDATGQATYCYVGSNGGLDSIVGSLSNLSDTVTYQWIANQPPVARCADRTVVADGTCQGDASVDDGSYDPDNYDTVTCTQSPAGPYTGPGSTQVTLTCVDSEGAEDSCQATITIVDTTAPMLTCPDDQTLECVDGGAIATFSASASDNCELTDVGCQPPSGATFPLGDTTATCTAQDSSSNSASCDFAVHVVDTQPPVVTPAPPALLWPPNHWMRPFDLAECITSVVDACNGDLDVAASATITRITSDEPEDDKLGRGGQGDGDTCNDIELTGPRTANLRVERMGRQNGRAYTVHFEVVDGSGNLTSGSCKVGVPHDQSDPADVPDDGCQYCVGSGCGTCPGHDAACTY